MSSAVPEGWRAERLGDVSALITKGTTPKTYSNEGVNFIKVESISSNRTLIMDKFSKVDLETHNLQKRSQLESGDILFSIAGTLGRLATVVKEDLPANTNQALAIIRLNGSNIYREYCLQHLSADSIQTEIQNLQTVGAQPNLSLQQISDLLIPCPPLPEQKKIASILTSVDEVIENTQKQIDKLQDLKKATMNELLTKGIGHTEFKDSELGRIPKTWNVVSFGELGKWQGGGTPSKSKPDFWDGDILWVSPKDMKNELIERTADRISTSAVENSSVKLITKGAILVVVRSGILKHTLPVAIANRDVTVNQDMKALSVKAGVSHLYVYHYLLSKNHEILRSTLKAGNTVESIDTQVFADYPIPLPPVSEQSQIAKIVDAMSAKIALKRHALSQTQSLKKSLMQDLLTGKVRVKVN